MHPVIPYLAAAGLFGLGCYGVLVRRNAVLLLMAVELMLNAVNLVLVTADTTVRAALPHSGQVFALFVIVLAAAEIGVGLAIVLQLYRLRRSVALDEVLLDGEPDDGDGDDADGTARHAAPGSAGALG
jgi:NADH-quinone oxidoreductase subunit K